MNLSITAKPAEDLSATSDECPPECYPAQAPGRKNVAPWFAFHLQDPVVTCASMPVIESLTPLFSCYFPSSLTAHPQGYIKICFPKGELKMGHFSAADPTDTSSCAHKDDDCGFREHFGLSGRFSLY